jgi:hypothetical protein
MFATAIKMSKMPTGKHSHGEEQTFLCRENGKIWAHRDLTESTRGSKVKGVKAQLYPSRAYIYDHPVKVHHCRLERRTRSFRAV